MAAPALVLKAAASILANEKSRKAVGWVLIAVLSPIILLLAFFCTSFSGGAEHNRTVVDLCFHGGAIPEGTPAEYQAYIQEMRDSFALLDAAMQTMEGRWTGRCCRTGIQCRRSPPFGPPAPAVGSCGRRGWTGHSRGQSSHSSRSCCGTGRR